MSYRIQVFHPAANAYLPAPRTSRSLRTLRRLIASAPLAGPGRARIVDDATGRPIPAAPSAASRPRIRPLTLEDIARVMGVRMERKTTRT